MASLNKIILIGNLGADPETRYTAGGDAVCTLNLATTERHKDKGGQQQEQTEWHRVVLFRHLAEIAAQHLRKGSQVYVEGSLKTRKWQDKSGQDRYTTEVQVQELKMLGRAPDAPGGRPEPGKAPNPAQRQTPSPAQKDPWLDAQGESKDFGVFKDDDVPF